MLGYFICIYKSIVSLVLRINTASNISNISNLTSRFCSVRTAKRFSAILRRVLSTSCQFPGCYNIMWKLQILQLISTNQTAVSNFSTCFYTENTFLQWSTESLCGSEKCIYCSCGRSTRALSPIDQFANANFC